MKTVPRKPAKKTPSTTPPPPAPATTATGKPIQPGRVGRVVIAGHFLPPVQRELKIIAANEGTTLSELLREALTLLFAQRGIASVDKLEGVSTK